MPQAAALAESGWIMITVETVLTHTPWWTAEPMGYGRLWGVRGQFG